MKKIVAMTTVCADIFPETGEIFPGGEALNFAAACSKYGGGIQIGIVGAVGDDEAGKAALRAAGERNIDISCLHTVKGGVTANNRIYIDSRGDRYFKSDSWTNGVYGDFKLSDTDREMLKNSDLVFITSYCPSLSEVIRLKKEYGFALAVDFDVRRDFGEMEEPAAAADYFFISGEESILGIFKAWSEKYDCVFNVTLAEKGSVTFHKGVRFDTAAVHAERVVDTTGCGDSYHGAFICSHLTGGDIHAAMLEGSKAAAETLAHFGGI
ncbi:MAG: PfkB family carbohydrate kinase [Ruminococcus sp.]|nr:PfkB family carbohydrate kinase [Ruminococcus sp.]